MMINRVVSYLPLSVLMSFSALGQQTQAQLTATMKNLEIQHDSLSHRLVQETTAISLTEQLISQDNTVDTNDIQYLCDFPAPHTLASLQQSTQQYITACEHYIDTIIEHQVINSEILGLKNKVQDFRDEIESLYATYAQQDQKISYYLQQFSLLLAQSTTKQEQIELLKSHDWCYESELYMQINLQIKLLDDLVSKDFFAEGLGNNADLKEIFTLQRDHYEALYKRVGDFLLVTPAHK